VHSHNSLWNLRKEVAEALELAPKQLQLFLGTGSNATELKDIDNGKSMSALGLTGGEALTAQKSATIEEHIPNAPLVDQAGELTPAARRIFTGWYRRFCDANGAFTKEGAARFIQACCGDLPPPTDQRIAGLFQTYDRDGDGNIEEPDFLAFYTSCSRGEKALTVRENLKAFNVRPDLKKASDVEDEAAPRAETLPRYFMPRDQGHFDCLMSLLEAGDDALAVAAWELIQMLATNAPLYKRVLKLDIAKQANSLAVDWNKFFDRSSAYRLLYTIQIVQAVLEEGEAEPKGVSIVNASDYPGSKAKAAAAAQGKAPAPKPAPAGPTEEVDDQTAEAMEKLAQDLTTAPDLMKASSQIAESPEEDAELRAQWAEEFL
jgi:hypothetical protein